MALKPNQRAHQLTRQYGVNAVDIAKNAYLWVSELMVSQLILMIQHHLL